MTPLDADTLPSSPPVRAPRRWRKLLDVLRQEVGTPPGPAFALAGLLARLLPSGGWGRVRAMLYRTAGQSIGPGTLLLGPVTYGAAGRAARHVRLGARCFINAHVFIDAAGQVTLGDGVSIGHHTVIVTADHAFGPPEFRAGALRPRPVTLGDGAWIAAAVTILPGVTVGAGAVVAAGAVVTKDLPPHTLAAGIPARVIRTLPS